MATNNNAENCVKLQITKTSLDSLVFFSFGATLDEECMLEYIIRKAFFDATNQGAFNTLIEKDDVRKSNIEGAKASATEALSKAIKEYKEPKGESFGSWHSDICAKVKSSYDAKGFEEEFSYGNAQKVVNMTLKYLYILGGIDYDNEIGRASCRERV